VPWTVGNLAWPGSTRAICINIFGAQPRFKGVQYSRVEMVPAAIWLDCASGK
jgi:hypothetical protein